MFGFLYSLFIGTAAVGKGVKDLIDESQRMNKARSEGRDWYLTRRGQQRLASNGKDCFTVIDPKTHQRMLVDEDDKVIRNYTEERREQARLKAISEGKTAYRYTQPEELHHNGIYKDIYKDLKTGEIYTIKGSGTNEFYINSDGYAVRPTDTCMEIINSFQEKMPEVYKKCLESVQFSMDNINELRKISKERNIK